MYQVVSADFSGFVRAEQTRSFTVDVDPNTGYGRTDVAVYIFPGGDQISPWPGPVCTPLAGSWEGRYGAPLEPGSELRYLQGTSSARVQPENSWTIVAHVEYQHGSTGPIPAQVSGEITGYALFAVYGGIARPA